MKKLGLLLISICFLVSCSITTKNIGVVDFNEYSLGTKVEPKCKLTSPSYRYIERTTGNYRDVKSNFLYTITLDSQVNLSTQKSPYTANQLALALHSVYLASRDLFANPALSNKIQQSLSHVHFIVAKDKQNFDYLWVEPNTEIHYLAKMSSANDVCFETPNGAQFTAVIMPQYFSTNDSYAIIHEIMHWVALDVYGDYDINHSNQFVWNRTESNTWPRISVLKLSQKYFGKYLRSK